MKGDTYKETIHDGSVSYSVIRVARLPGTGKHAKNNNQILRRRYCSAIARKLKANGLPNPYALASAIVYNNK